MLTDSRLALLLLAFTCHFMCGLIWFVQIVHYPLFIKIGLEQFRAYEQLHCSLTGSVVMVPMVVQLLLSIWLVKGCGAEDARLLWPNLGLVIIIWLVTAFCSVPCHNNLCRDGFSNSEHSYLLSMNWVRTACWTLCSILTSLALYGHMRAN